MYILVIPKLPLSVGRINVCVDLYCGMAVYLSFALEINKELICGLFSSHKHKDVLNSR